MEKRFASLVFIIVGIGILIAGAFFAIETFDFLNRAAETEAVVVDFKIKQTSDGWVKYPIFEFVDLNGAEVNAVGNVNTPYSIGEKVKIFYDSENPSGQVYAGILNVWIIPLILLGVGTMFTGIGSYSFKKLSDKETQKIFSHH